MKLQRITSHLVLLFLFQMAAGQTLQEELKRFYHDLYEVENYHIMMEIKVFEQAADESPVISMNYQMKRSGSKYWYSMDDAEYLFNDRCVLIVNTTDKYVHYSEKEENPRKVREAILPDFDSTLRSVDSIVYKGLVDGQRKYTLYNHNGQIQVMDMYFDAKDNRIRRMVYLYNPTLPKTQGKVEINYTGWNTSPSFAENEFSESRYINNNKGHITAANAYRDYLIIENE